MAIMLVCDKCGSGDGVETIDWEIGRQTGQIDLCSSCLRASLATVSKKAPPKLAPRKKKPLKATRVSHSEIRAWAKAQGMNVPDKGRVPTEVMQAYEKRNKAPSLDSL